MRGKKLDIDILVTARNGGRKIMQSIRITSILIDCMKTGFLGNKQGGKNCSFLIYHVDPFRQLQFRIY